MKQRGSILVIAIFVALGMGLLLISIARTFQTSTHEAVYFNAMNTSYRLAETALNDAIGKITVNPSSYLDPSFTDSISYNGDSTEVFSHSAQRRNDVVPGGYYIVSSATKTLRGKEYCCRLHSHVRISNSADYFWAVAQDLVLAQGSNASQGKVYANNLTFITGGTGVTRVLSAEYMTSVLPSTANFDTGGAPLYKSGGTIQISENPSAPSLYQKPLHNPAGIVFPQISESDLKWYRELAKLENEAGVNTDPNDDHHVCDFSVAPFSSGQIYPPGYQGTVFGDDGNPIHTPDNADHVYYCSGDMNIQGTVHGQVLFVAEGNIFITGNLTSFGGANTPPPADSLPGAGFVSSSTAHQAVLITRQNVVIRNGIFTGAGTLTIDAFILAPNGSLLGEVYSGSCGASLHNDLNLNFTGSIIVGFVNNFCSPTTLPYGSFAAIYKNSRNYSYMNSLITDPPPYIPSLTEIKYSYEETTYTPGLY